MSTTDSDSNKIAKQTLKSRNQNKQTFNLCYQTNFDTQNQMEDHFCMIYVILSLVEAAEKVLH